MKFRDTEVGGFFIVSDVNEATINKEIQQKLSALNADMEDAQYSTTVLGNTVQHHVLIMYKRPTGPNGAVVTPTSGCVYTTLDMALRTAMYLEAYTGRPYYVRTKLVVDGTETYYEYLAKAAHVMRSLIEYVDIANPRLKDDRIYNLNYSTFQGMIADTGADTITYEVLPWKEKLI